MRKFEKLNFYEVVNEEEFKRDPKATKIGTKWDVTNKSTKTKPMIKPAWWRKSSPTTPRRGRAVCRNARASRAAVLSVQACNQQMRGRTLIMCGSDGREKCFLLWPGLDDPFSSMFPQKTQRVSWMEYQQMWWGSLYGTRDAPLIWQDCLRCQMKLLGFKESLRVPCVFYHETKDVEMIAHVK